MEIIDAKHIEYKKHSGGRKPTPIISFDSRNRIYISQKAMDLLELDKNDRIHFASEFDRLYIYANNNKSGIRFHKHRKGEKTGSFICGPLSVLDILKKRHPSKISAGRKFLLKPMLSKINESITAEILLNKTI